MIGEQAAQNGVHGGSARHRFALAPARQEALALVERAAPQWHSPAAERTARPWFAWCLRAHVLWQAALLALGVSLAQGAAWPAVVALGLAVGGISGSLGITFAHELGHSRSRVDRFSAWLLCIGFERGGFGCGGVAGVA